MKTIIYSTLFCSLIAYILTGCSNNTTSADGSLAADSVAISITQSADSALYALDKRNQCTIKCAFKASYPSDKALHKVFAQAILETPDSLQFSEAINNYAKMIVEQYTSQNSNQMDSIESECASIDPLKRFECNIVITCLLNKNNLLTFSKKTTYVRNGRMAGANTSFYNIHLPDAKLLRASDLFVEGSMGEVGQLMRAKLLEQLNVQSEDNLVDFGYIALDNVVPNNNFYFGDKGVTWSFYPQEIAISSVGEPKITVNYSELRPFAAEGTVMSKLCSSF